MLYPLTLITAYNLPTRPIKGLIVEIINNGSWAGKIINTGNVEPTVVEIVRDLSS